MKVTLLLADAAQAVNGKLYILGGGWSITNPTTDPFAIALKIDVPWSETNRRHTLVLELIDEDGKPAMLPTPTGESPLRIESVFEVGRPPGLKQGTSLDVPLAVNFAPLPLKPNTTYVWKCTIDGASKDDWRLTFTTRAADPRQTPHGPQAG